MSATQKKRVKSYPRDIPPIRSRLRRRTTLISIIAFLAAWIIFRLVTGSLLLQDISDFAGELAGIRSSTRPNVTSGKVVVVSVPDGDTLEVRRNGGKIERLRLYGVDAPELKQQGGKESKAFAESLLHGGTITIDIRETDQYGRGIALLHLENGRIANEEIIRAGHAWVYRNYCHEAFCNQWLALEHLAKKQGLGFWRHHNPIPPWKWRKNNPRQ